MKTLYNYFKSQAITLTLLLLFIIAPYILFCKYLSVIPYMHYFFLIILFLIKIMVFEEKNIKKKLQPKVQSELTKELKRNPSGNEIYKRIKFHIKARDFSLLTTGVTVLIIAIFFEQF